MGQVKKPVIIEIDTAKKEDKPASISSAPIEYEPDSSIREHPVIRLLTLYLEKRELLDDYEERKAILDILKQFVQPHWKTVKKAAPIEQEWLEKSASKNNS